MVVLLVEWAPLACYTTFLARSTNNAENDAKVWTLLRVLEWTTSRFIKAEIESARLEAQLLLAHVLSCDRVALYTAYDKPLADEELAQFRMLIRRRLAGESVAYLIGRKEFWSREFKVDRRVLVPRADTEVLVEAVLDRTADFVQGPIADVGTGSGVIAITLACELPQRAVVAIDISSDALDVAHQNAEANGVNDRVRFVQGNLLDSVSGPFAVLVANLPYVESAQIPRLDAEVRCEPHQALDGGTDGLDLIRELIQAAPSVLADNGWLFLEHGDDQGKAIRALLNSCPRFKDAETKRDLAGRERVTMAMKPITP